MKILKINTNNNNIYVNTWDEVNQPKGLVLVIHSFKQSGKNYADLAEFLNKHDYIVWATDVRYHGKHYNDNNDYTNISTVARNSDIFKEIVNDHYITAKLYCEKYNLPLTIIGHGFGAHVAKRLVQISDFNDKLILSGCAYPLNPSLLRLKTALFYINLFNNKQVAQDYFERRFYGTLIKNNPVGNWYSLNTKLYESFIKNSHALPLQFYKSWLNNVAVKQKNIKNINKNMSIMVMAGRLDPYSGGEKEQQKIVNHFKKHDLDCKLTMFNGLKHNLYEDDDKNIVFQHILHFIKE